jgi:hypothetical protein
MAATGATPGYRAALYQGAAPAGRKEALAIGAEAVGAALGAEAVAAAIGAAVLVEAAAPGAVAFGALLLGVVALGAVARGTAARGTVPFGAAEFFVYPCLCGVVGRRRARAGCHFHKFPDS